MDPNKLQTNNMHANHLQDPHTIITDWLYSHLKNQTIMVPDREGEKKNLHMQGPVND